jgi:Rgg/GadR/MutR family transcriptional activator
VYGETLKKIREAKGFKQKEVCQGVVTLSYYSRIERNKSQPTIEVFVNLLAALNMSLEEFLFIHRGNQKSWFERKWDLVADAYHRHDVNYLKKARLEFTANTSSKAAFIVTAIDLFIIRLTNAPFVAENVTKLLAELITIENWTYLETKFFIILMDQIPLESCLTLVNRFFKNKKIYNVSDGYNSLYNKMLLNITLLCIDANDLKNAKKYTVMLAELIETRDLFSKNMLLYFKGIIAFKEGNQSVGQKMIDDAFDIWKRLDMTSFSKKYQQFFEKIKKGAN